MTPAKLRELLAAATPLAWRQDSVDCVDNHHVYEDHGDYDTVALCVDAKDAALIAAAVNALPALLDCAEALEALEPGRVVEAMDGVGQSNLRVWKDAAAALAALNKETP